MQLGAGGLSDFRSGRSRDTRVGLESPPGVQALLDGLPMFAIRFSRTLSKWQLCLRIISALTALSVKPMVSSIWSSLSLSLSLCVCVCLSLTAPGTNSPALTANRIPSEMNSASACTCSRARRRASATVTCRPRCPLCSYRPSHAIMMLDGSRQAAEAAHQRRNFRDATF